jgi:hypothetical protein
VKSLEAILGTLGWLVVFAVMTGVPALTAAAIIGWLVGAKITWYVQ